MEGSMTISVEPSELLELFSAEELEISVPSSTMLMLNYTVSPLSTKVSVTLPTEAQVSTFPEIVTVVPEFSTFKLP